MTAADQARALLKAINPNGAQVSKIRMDATGFAVEFVTADEVPARAGSNGVGRMLDDREEAFDVGYPDPLPYEPKGD